MVIVDFDKRQSLFYRTSESSVTWHVVTGCNKIPRVSPGTLATAIIVHGCNNVKIETTFVEELVDAIDG